MHRTSFITTRHIRDWGGILKSGGLRATYRKRMNDAGEFDYAKNVIYEALKEIGKRHNLSSVAQGLTIYIRKNLDQFLKDTIEMSRSYCACLTISSDDPEQWTTYAEDGKGFAIGFNLRQFLIMQIPARSRGEPYVFCAPVIYNEHDQRDLVWHFIKAGISDLHNFAETRSQQSEHLTALRDRVTQEIVVHLLILIDFIKAPSYSREREMRLFLDPNNGTSKAANIQNHEQTNESIPFILMDLRNPQTRRLPLTEIKVGPKSSFLEEMAFLDKLLDEHGYGNNYGDRPRITKSLVESCIAK